MKPRKSGMRRSYMKRWAADNTRVNRSQGIRQDMGSLNYGHRARKGMDVLAFMGIDINNVPNEPRERAFQMAERMSDFASQSFLRNHVMLYNGKHRKVVMVFGNKGGHAVIMETAHGVFRRSIVYRSTERAKDKYLNGRVLWAETLITDRILSELLTQ